MLLSCQGFFKFLKLSPLISMFLYGNLVVKYKLYGGSNMSVVVIPSVSTLSGVLPWVISSLKHREGDFSRNLAFHPPISSTQTYCLSYPQEQYWESFVVLPLMFGLRFTPTRQGRSDTPLQRYSLHIYSASCVIPCPYIAETKYAAYLLMQPNAALVIRKHAFVTKAILEGSKLRIRDNITRHRNYIMSIRPKELILWRDLSKIILKKSLSHSRK